MKKWTLTVLLVVVAIVSIVFVQNNKPVKADGIPEPFIKFDGSTVKYAENIPDCH